MPGEMRSQLAPVEAGVRYACEELPNLTLAHSFTVFLKAEPSFISMSWDFPKSHGLGSDKVLR